MRRTSDVVCSAIRKGRALFEDKNEISILYVYRILSLALTAAFYLISSSLYPLLYKLGTIAALCVSAVIVMNLYENAFRLRRSLPWAVVIVETLGIGLLLIPTGGLGSPFLWYALNPVLVSACYFSVSFGLGNLLFYCCSAVGVTYWLHNPQGSSLFAIAGSHARVFLVFALITGAVYLLARMMRRMRGDAQLLSERSAELEQLNKELIKSNETVEATVEHMMDLYRCVGVLTRSTDHKTLLQMFADYAVLLSGAAAAFVSPDFDADGPEGMLLSGELGGVTAEDVLRILDAAKGDSGHAGGVYVSRYGSFTAAVVSVTASGGFCGRMGILFEDAGGAAAHSHRIYKLSFLAQLCGVVLERFSAEEMENRLLIAQEQNRIANEMHDNVAQRLFAIVCAVHTMNARWDSLSEEELRMQLELLDESASCASRELRSCIYALSSGRGRQAFFSEIRRYLDSLAKLGGLAITTTLSGNDSALPDKVKSSVSRIVREATGNAIRHGMCGHIELSIQVLRDCVHIDIRDDGAGADLAALERGDRAGLGLGNMKALAQSHKGAFTIDSSPGGGTRVCVALPTAGEALCSAGGKIG